MRSWGLSLSLLLAGCTGQMGGDAAENRADVAWDEGVRFPEQDERLQAVEVAEDFRSVVLRYREPSTRPVREGDIVTGGRDGGYLLRVTGVAQVDERTVRLETTGVPLQDAIVDMDLDYDSTRDAVATGEFVGDVGARTEALTSSLRFRLAEHASAFVAGVENARVDFENSEVTVAPEVRAQLVISGREIEIFEVEIEACAHVRAVANVQAVGGSVAGGVTIDVPLAVEAPFAIGPVPATFKLQPSIGLNVRMADGSSVRAGIDATVCFTAGGRYEGATDRFTPIWDASLDASVVGPELGAGSELSLSLGAGPRATLYLFGVVGPTVSLSFYGRGAVEPDAGGLGWGVYAGVKGSVGLDLRVPGGFIRGLRFEHTFAPLERQIASGHLGGASPGSCGSDADCSMGEACVDAACVAGTPVFDCLDDADCAVGERCDRSTCVPVAPAPTPECRSDADCTHLQRCDGGSCVTWAQCIYDSDCAAGSTCMANRCVAPPPATGCAGLPAGRNGDSCAGVAAETWRCACDPTWGDVSQVCRAGIWQTLSTSPSDCSSCSGAYSAGCSP